MIFYGKQYLDEEDINAVVNTLKSDFLTTGPKVKEFEEKFSQYVNAKYAVAVSNGTAALHIASLAVGLKKDDELITTPITFAASANVALYSNAKPVFIDIKENGLIDEELIEKKITEKTKIIIPVHYAGLPCNMEKIKEIADKHNITIIEDACHALGSTYKDSKIGDCQYSKMTCFSFHPVKHITTGEGGMITTNDENLYKTLLKLRSHGITREDMESNDPWYNEMQILGYNYRITDFQCALGISQLKKVNQFVEKRRNIARKYDLNINLPKLQENQNQKSSYHLYVIKTKDKETRLRLFNHLKENNIYCQIHYIPVYWHPYYQKLGYKKGLCPKAEEFYNRIISIPIYPTLKQEEQDKVIEIINNFQ